MFSNKGLDGANRERKLLGSNIKSFLGVETEFDGRVIFNESTRLDGTFRGEIFSKDILIVGDKAHLQADVLADTLIISGQFHGNIRGKTRVELRSPVQVIGHIDAPAISIEDGVIFNGTIKMNGCVEIEKGEKVAA